MSSVLGVSVGAGAIRLARPPAGAEPGTVPDPVVPESFELRTFVVPPETPSAERAALSVAAALNSNPAITATVLACRDEQQARALHSAMNDHALTDYEIVPDIEAVVEFATAAGALKDVSSLAVFDLGASGLSVTVVDVSTRQVRHTERTGDISGEYFDSLIREQQINSGRIAHPPDPAGLAELDALCRSAKERLSAGNAVALPSGYGPVLLTQENFTALIARAVETAARATREVIERSGRPVQAVLAVGGGMRIPLVSRALRDAVDMPVLVPPEPETATARGAALLAGRARNPRPADPVPARGITPDAEHRASSAEATARSTPGHPDGSDTYPQADTGRALPSATTPIPGVGAGHPGDTRNGAASVPHDHAASAHPAAPAPDVSPMYAGGFAASPATATAHPGDRPALPTPTGKEPGPATAPFGTNTGALGPTTPFGTNIGSPDLNTAPPGTGTALPASTEALSGPTTAQPGSTTAPPDSATGLPNSATALRGTNTGPTDFGTALPGSTAPPPDSGTSAESGRTAVHADPVAAPTGGLTHLTPSAGPTTHSGTHPYPSDPLPTPGSDRPSPEPPIPHEGIFGPPTEAPSTLLSVGAISSRPGQEPISDRPAPAAALPAPLSTPVPRLSEDEDPPTVALRLPAKLLPRRSFGEPPQRPNREISAAMVAVSALVVVASIGIGLGYGQHMFSQDSATVQGTSQPQTTSAGTPSATTPPSSATTPPPEHAPLAEPPPVYLPEPEAAATTTAGPNTFQVPGLPPIVVPTIPPEALPFSRPTPTER
ncbi:FGGY-family carbohydrate kinase [Nocardia carnea]|uniref:FGGY-family carbohydrate kinase n=1 Tax=Nocardia carnea TaxID=37328 RepID=UPI0024558A5E|nr:FGGY-family carbohydrate kinase [Nocardia carnea]